MAYLPLAQALLLHQRRQQLVSGKVYTGLYAVQVLECHHHFLERRVASAFTETVHRGVNVGGTGDDGGQGIGRGQAEIVVGVHFQFDIHGAAQPGDLGVGGGRV